ncbi:sigma factor-like helix-turn-helix DNA-binding protein [Streptomyces sannanensis]|uniref:sigma factor-like helix-turn-helix DNA-binding protein n=1 Tax=Streptomyces sannanensis TaxID=285536 RepID=UPI0031E862B8
MGERQAYRQRRRAREFEAFAAGVAGRLMHTASLLTGEPAGHCPHAERLLTAALARTYAEWDRLRGEDPYNRAREELVGLFARAGWRHRRRQGGLLEPLTPGERLILVLRLYEGIAEEQTAALVGIPVGRVQTICTRAISTMYAS